MYLTDPTAYPRHRMSHYSSNPAFDTQHSLVPPDAPMDLIVNHINRNQLSVLSTLAAVIMNQMAFTAYQHLQTAWGLRLDDFMSGTKQHTEPPPQYTISLRSSPPNPSTATYRAMEIKAQLHRIIDDMFHYVYDRQVRIINPFGSQAGIDNRLNPNWIRRTVEADLRHQLSIMETVETDEAAVLWSSITSILWQSFPILLIPEEMPLFVLYRSDRSSPWTFRAGANQEVQSIRPLAIIPRWVAIQEQVLNAANSLNRTPSAGTLTIATPSGEISWVIGLWAPYNEHYGIYIKYIHLAAVYYTHFQYEIPMWFNVCTETSGV